MATTYKTHRAGTDMGLFGHDSNKGPAPIDRREAMQSIPAINPGVTFQKEDDGHLMALVPTKRPSGFLSRFMASTSTRRIRLDEIGAFVIENINGKRTVQEIVDAFAAKYRVNRREAELSMADFLKSLVQRNIIAIGIR